ncbi:uncharacterized protein NECHADRAFT_89164 [Fusarium vanettenii 77-13-4]|uniref:Uncharacterized protein n=1 Tax=Fusarium vanettenii (strain ATCC MYA-4622 / CBS 123669 / FGSC 9596 / NRRL 45880 / 77-13-4) TaxID=660122 RepID=C7ZQE8_FUSV7|nr:uncharacterized protein NECHADRAFT_89164 [Fusarium vanettenii 77-13-4]EEU33756.1 predicted protein [Fusarium vanettenii 77-13-4]
MSPKQDRNPDIVLRDRFTCPADGAPDEETGEQNLSACHSLINERSTGLQTFSQGPKPGTTLKEKAREFGGPGSSRPSTVLPQVPEGPELAISRLWSYWVHGEGWETGDYVG